MCACGCGRETVGQAKFRRECRAAHQAKPGRQMSADPEFQREMRQAVAKPCTVLCQHCDWSEETTSGEAAAAYARHREECSAVLVAA